MTMAITAGHFHKDPRHPAPEHDRKEVQYLGFNREWGLHFFRDLKSKETFVVKPGGKVVPALEDIRKRFGFAG